MQNASGAAGGSDDNSGPPAGPPPGTGRLAGSLTSKFTGVCWNKKNKRWQASINSGGKYLYLGSFTSEVEAAKVFDQAAIQLRGRDTKLNFPLENYLDENGQVSATRLAEQQWQLIYCNRHCASRYFNRLHLGYGSGLAVVHMPQMPHNA